MKIVMFSINPLFPKVVTGGASKHLYYIAQHLGSLGHEVQILCAKSDEVSAPFTWVDHVSVFPVLPFHLPFPQPYAVSGADLALIVGRTANALVGADRFYIHDGEFLLPDVYAEIPTIASFRDNIYPESVLGSFIGKFDEVICVSEYSAEVIEHTVGRFYPDLRSRMHQVNNGIDFDVFSPVDPADLADELGLDPQNETILLHPHRPEPGKGLPETIQVVNRLVHQHGITNLKVLVPGWIGSMVSSGESHFYEEMMRLMEDLGVREYFRFIHWMPLQRMPALYSLGDVTLCLGNVVEAFGNVAYESLACGTPSVVAKVGVHRTLMPDDLIDKVNYGDIEAAVECVLTVLNGDRKVTQETRNFLKETMNFERQVNAYAEIITQCKKREPLRFSTPKYDSTAPYILAPWCYLNGDRIYHDFRGIFEPAKVLAVLLRQSDAISRQEASDAGIPSETWETWIERTYIVPK
jgi:glycosyltransferase involved in cell wall biosynthesis